MNITRPHLTKLDSRGPKVVFIDYEPRRIAYKHYYPVGGGGRAHVSRDVVFDENTFWRWNNVIEADQNIDQFTEEYLVT